MPLTVSRCRFWHHELTLQEKSMLRGLKPAWQRSGKNPLHPVLDLIWNKYQEFGFRLLNSKFERRFGIRKTSICSPTNSEAAPQRQRCHQVGFVRGSVATNQPTALQRGCPNSLPRSVKHHLFSSRLYSNVMKLLPGAQSKDSLGIKCFSKPRWY